MMNRTDNNTKNRKKHKILRILPGILLAAVLLIGIGSFVYISDYYHAGKEAAAELADPPAGVTVTYGDHQEMIFCPESDSCTAGLIFYPGGKVEYTAYAPLMIRLAERGILCIVPKMPGNLAILDTKAADGIQEEYPEIRNWYIGGHSLGGVCAAMYLEDLAESDQSTDKNQNVDKDHGLGGYQGLLLLGAYSSVDLSDSDLAVLAIYGENDGVMNREKYEEDKVNLPADFTEEVIEGGCHAWFGDYGEQKGDGPATITPEEQWEETADDVAQWIPATE